MPALAQRLGATDDLHDLGGDGVLAGPVHDPAQVLDQLVGVVGGRLHGPLAGGVLGRGRSSMAARTSASSQLGKQPVQDLGRLRLELVVGLVARDAAGVPAPRRSVRRPCLAAQRDQLALGDDLGAERDEAGVDQLDLVELAGLEGSITAATIRRASS